MRVFDVKVLSYNKDEKSYNVEYCLEQTNGVVRRSKTKYSNGKLLRDAKITKLKKEVEEKVLLFNSKK